MATPTEIMASVASLMNDTAQNQYTSAAILPYLNIALRDLEELFQLNNIPVTNEVSTVLEVTAGVVVIGFATTPALPTDLIEVRSCLERQTGTNNTFVGMEKRTFLPQQNTTVSQFGVWAWIDDEIHVLEANTSIDLKLQYIKKLFSTIEIGDVDDDLGVLGVQQYLTFRTSSLCAEFIGENKTRAESLDGYAIDALSRALSIPTKGKQSIPTRRLPFRAKWKSRGSY